MAVVDVLGAIRVKGRVKAEDDCDHLTPIRPIGVGILQPDISCQMALVVRGDAETVRRTVFKGWHGHADSSLKYDFLGFYHVFSP